MQVQVSLKIERAATAGLSQREQQIQQAGQQAMREALKQAIRQQEEHHNTCPHCGGKQRRLEGTVRRSIATTFGRVQVARRRFRCQGCWHRWCPANQLFTELKGATMSQPLREAAMLAGCSWPYRVASGLLKRLSGAQISAEEIRRLPTGAASSEPCSSKRRQSGHAPLPPRRLQQQRRPSSPCWWDWMEAGCVAGSSGEGWKGKWRSSVPREKTCRCPPPRRPFPGASEDSDSPHGNGIAWQSDATSRALVQRRYLANRPKPQHRRSVAAPRGPW